MANNITPKLKAYVQTDATGRVVSGTPVFRTSKPKSGTWREIPMYYRGDSSTTTTTTAGGGGVTPTAYIAKIAYTGPSIQWKACNNPDLINVVYTNVSTFPLPPNTPIYLDAALTMLLYPTSTVAISIEGYVYEIVNGYTNPLGGTGTPCAFITTTTTTTTQGLFNITAYYQGNSSTSQLCPQGSTGSGTTPLLSNTATIQAGSMLYTSPGVPLTFGGFYYKQVGQDAVFYAANDNGVAVQYNCPATIDFTVFSACDGSPGYNPVVRANNITGTSTGNVYFSFSPQLTEQLAIDNIYTGAAFNDTTYLYGTAVPGGWTVGQTYYVAGQDVNNPANMIVKTVTIASCS